MPSAPGVSPTTRVPVLSSAPLSSSPRRRAAMSCGPSPPPVETIRGSLSPPARRRTRAPPSVAVERQSPRLELGHRLRGWRR